MATATLTATGRSTSGKGAARALRRDAQVPAVIYGHGREPQSLALPARELGKLLDRIGGDTTVVELTIDGGMSRALIKEVQRHPVRRHEIIHVDFQALVAGERMIVRVPIHLVGVAEGVRVGRGVLDQSLRDVEIEVDSSSIPSHIDVDVTTLTIGHTIHVSEITLPEGAKIIGDAGAAVATIAAPATAEAVPAAEGAAEPEVIRAKKPDEK